MSDTATTNPPLNPPPNVTANNRTARQEIAYRHPLGPKTKELPDMIQGRRLSAFYKMWTRVVILDFDSCVKPYWVSQVWFTEKDEPEPGIALEKVPVPFLVELHDEGQAVLAGVGDQPIVPKMTNTSFFFRKPLTQTELYDLPLTKEMEGEFA